MTAPSDTASAMECKKDGLQQKQDGTWKLTVNVHPNDMPAWLLAAAMGTRLQCAIVQIGDDEQPIPQEKAKTPFADMSRAQQAGMLCNDVAFQKWWLGFADDPEEVLVENEDPAEIMAENVRNICGVVSRAELNTNPEAATIWDRLVADYREATGRDTEQRG